jgi:hypothetical protein
MQFQLNTDANIKGDDRLAEVAENTVVAALGHLKDRLSRIEVHLADVNAAKGGDDDIRCTIEARPEGMQPQAVTHADANVEAAARSAAVPRIAARRQLNDRQRIAIFLPTDIDKEIQCELTCVSATGGVSHHGA